MTNMFAEAELFSALAGLPQKPPVEPEEMQASLATMDKIIELYEEVEEENPKSDLLVGARMAFQGAAGSMMTEDACYSFWNTFMMNSQEQFSISRARIEISRMLYSEFKIDPNILTKMAMFGSEQLDLRECMVVIRAISEGVGEA